MKLLMTGLLLLVASSANAAVINFDETTSERLNTEFQISGESTHVQVTDGEYGLEWLDFGTHNGDGVTFGFSVDNAVAAYDTQGFRLATETEISDLFSFFYTDFTDSGNGTMTFAEDPASELNKERNSWLTAFGTHEQTSGSELGQELYSTGMYIDDDGSVQLAGFKIFLDPGVETTLYSTDFTVGFLDANTGYDNLGVFMVRDYVPAVPIPAAVWLFGSGLLGLAAVARRKNIK